MFQKVEYSKLIEGQKYKIYNFTGIYKQLTYLNELYVEFDNLKLNGKTCWRKYFLITSPIYQFVSTNPQWKMERRSVNLIVQRILGDEYFQW
jgi:hypothetical protein